MRACVRPSSAADIAHGPELTAHKVTETGFSCSDYKRNYKELYVVLPVETANCVAERLECTVG